MTASRQNEKLRSADDRSFGRAGPRWPRLWLLELRCLAGRYLFGENGEQLPGRSRPTPKLGAGSIGAKAAPMFAYSGDFPPPSPPAEKTTDRQDQAGQASTGDWTGNA
jgi:hypothetical protein